jgi:hypothetical protein
MEPGPDSTLVHRVDVVDPQYDATPDGPCGSATCAELEVEVAGAGTKAREVRLAPAVEQMEAQRCFIPMKHCADAEADGDGDGDGDGCMFAGGCPRCGRLRRRPSSGRRCGVIHDDKCRFGHCAAGKHLDVIDGSGGFAEMDEWITSGWSRNSERRGLPEREPV